MGVDGSRRLISGTPMKGSSFGGENEWEGAEYEINCLLPLPLRSFAPLAPFTSLADFYYI